MDILILKDQVKRLFESLTRPLTIYSLLTILFSSYIILRIFGIDYIAPILNKLGATTTNSAGVDINGNYVYETFGMDSAHIGYFHGGYITMEQSVNAYGVTFGLAGFRTWRKYKGKAEEKVTFPWSSEWGGIFGGKKIKFTYSILTLEGVKIRGFVEGDLHTDKDGKVDQIICNFNQLPPSPAMYGTMIIKRIYKDEISESDVYKIVPVTE